MFLCFYSYFSYSIEMDVRCKQDHHFTLSSNECKTWAQQGADLLGDYMDGEGKYNDSGYNTVTPSI